MYNPTTRLLTILELLQSRGEISGLELAQKLEVEERSIRRYIMMLRDMGIPIDGERGRHGGYSLRPGFRLPPLMFNTEEITAVIVGLMITRDLGISALAATESAAAKIERVLPDELRQSADALRSSLVVDNIRFGARTMPNEWIMRITLAIHMHKCLQMSYASAEGEITERLIAPHGLVLHARTGYLPAYCHLRKGIRLFRLDRIRSLSSSEQSFLPPENFDAKQFVFSSLATIPGTYTFEIMIHAPLSTVETIVTASTALLESRNDYTLMRVFSHDPHWLARYLTRLEMPFTVLENDVLRDAIQIVVDELLTGIKQ